MNQLFGNVNLTTHTNEHPKSILFCIIVAVILLGFSLYEKGRKP